MSENQSLFELHRAGAREEVVPLEQVECPTLQSAVTLWNTLRGARRFPSRGELSPRAMAPFLKDIVLIKVLNEGADFQYAIVGDGLVQGAGHPIQGKLLSDVEHVNAELAQQSRNAYRQVLQGAPLALRVWPGAGTSGTNLVYAEVVFLPLGPTEGLVDHILGVSDYVVRVPRSGSLTGGIAVSGSTATSKFSKN